MQTRTQLADALRAVLPAAWRVLDLARSMAEPDATIPAVVAVQRIRVQPAPNAQGSYLETFYIWLLEPSTDIDFIDDNLDDHLELLHDAIDSFNWLAWSGSERDTYDDTFHAYRVEVTIPTKKD